MNPTHVATCLALCLVLFVQSAHAAIDADEITSLPGFSGPLPSKQYSGYIEVAPTRFLHYWLVLSENQPSTDPVVLWMNGGPGCSSMDGYFYEQGPLHFVDPKSKADVGAVPSLEVNPYRWNKIANMIFLEAPAGVGFSYSTEPWSTDDNKTAVDNLSFLLGFFKGFSEFKKNEFFVSGESYAGIYVPTLVDQVRLYNEKSSDPINLQGFLVGNGCIGNSVGACSAQGTQIGVDFLFGHGLYSQALHAEIMKTCKDLENPSGPCITLLEQMGQEVGDVNVYDIYWPCIEGSQTKRPQRPVNSLKEWRERAGNNSRAMRIPPRPLDMYMFPEGPVGCIDGIQAGAYLNDAAVRSAIHVKPESAIGRWSICSAIDYNSNIASLLPLYPTLIKKYRTVIYNGDVDACVPYVGNQEWTSGLGFPVKKGWTSWTVDQQVAGYVTVYDVNNFTFITVKGSGHMVPEFRPPQAYAMFERFISNTPF